MCGRDRRLFLPFVFPYRFYEDRVVPLVLPVSCVFVQAACACSSDTSILHTWPNNPPSDQFSYTISLVPLPSHLWDRKLFVETFGFFRLLLLAVLYFVNTSSNASRLFLFFVEYLSRENSASAAPPFASCCPDRYVPCAMHL